MDPTKVNLMRQQLFIPVTQFTGLVPYFEVQSSGAIGANMEIGLSANTDAATVEGGTGIDALRTLQATAPNVVGSAGAFTAGSIPKLVEIGTLGLVGLKMNTVGDDVRHTMLIPGDWNRGDRIDARIVWATESVTETDGVTWKVLYKALTENVTALAAPATALNTIIAEDMVVPGTAKVLRTSPTGIINRNSIADAARFLSFLVSVDAQTGNPLSDGVYLLGIEFEYGPKLGQSGQGKRPAPAWKP